MSPASASAVPTTACDTIDSAPSLIAVQPAPRPPSARLKSSVRTVDVGGDDGIAVHVTVIVVTSAEATVPAAPEMLQVCPVGLAFIVTSYAAPSATGRVNVNAPFMLTLTALPSLSCNTTVPDNPDTVPPIEYEVG